MDVLCFALSSHKQMIVFGAQNKCLLKTEALGSGTTFVKTFGIKVTGSLIVYLTVACSVFADQIGPGTEADLCRATG